MSLHELHCRLVRGTPLSLSNLTASSTVMAGAPNGEGSSTFRSESDAAARLTCACRPSCGGALVRSGGLMPFGYFQPPGHHPDRPVSASGDGAWG